MWFLRSQFEQTDHRRKNQSRIQHRWYGERVDDEQRQNNCLEWRQGR